MSRPDNASRVNLSFRKSNKDQNRAYEALRKIENKTEYITNLILQDLDLQSEERKYTREDINKMLSESLPAILEKYLSEHGFQASSAPEKKEEPVFEEKTSKIDAETENLLFGALEGFGGF